MTESDACKHCLSDLRKKRSEWQVWLSGDDRSSIARQLDFLTWQIAVWRMTNEARSFLPADERNRVELNGPFMNLFDVSVFESIQMGIRRLVDSPSCRNSGDRGVHSLVGLLRDIQLPENLKLLRRDLLLETADLPYSEQDLKDELEEFWRTRNDGVGVVSDSPHWKKCCSDEMHGWIDEFCGVDSSRRSRDDTIFEALVPRIEKCVVDSADKIAKYVNKFIAHAATLRSREKAFATGDPRLKIRETWNAHRQILKVSALFARTIVGGNPLSIRVSEFGQFRYLDQPLVAQENIAELGEPWIDFKEEVDSWLSCKLSDIET
jgi:hypothetical protein